MRNDQKLHDELALLTEQLSAPDAFSDPKIGEKNRRRAELEVILATIEQKVLYEKQLRESNEILRENDSELSELAKLEIPELEQKLLKVEDKLTELLTPKDPNDHKNAAIETRAGAGGDEASLFASELLRMYLRYCETHSIKTEILSESPNDSGGHKEVIFLAKGLDVYKQLKFEGVRRQGRCQRQKKPMLRYMNLISKSIPTAHQGMADKALTPLIQLFVLLTSLLVLSSPTKTKNRKLKTV